MDFSLKEPLTNEEKATLQGRPYVGWPGGPFKSRPPKDPCKAYLVLKNTTTKHVRIVVPSPDKMVAIDELSQKEGGVQGSATGGGVHGGSTSHKKYKIVPDSNSITEMPAGAPGNPFVQTVTVLKDKTNSKDKNIVCWVYVFHQDDAARNGNYWYAVGPERVVADEMSFSVTMDDLKVKDRKVCFTGLGEIIDYDEPSPVFSYFLAGAVLIVLFGLAWERYQS